MDSPGLRLPPGKFPQPGEMGARQPLGDEQAPLPEEDGGGDFDDGFHGVLDAGAERLLFSSEAMV